MTGNAVAVVVAERVPQCSVGCSHLAALPLVIVLKGSLAKRRARMA